MPHGEGDPAQDDGCDRVIVCPDDEARNLRGDDIQQRVGWAAGTSSSSESGAERKVVGDPSFRDHSYRTFIGDATTGQALYMQNEGYDVAHLSFLNAGQWHGRGVIRWPFGDGYAKPQPLRLCYPNVQLRDGVAHFLGVGDIVEPVDAWREAKKKITGRDWDYVFRRLFYSRSQPLTQQANDPFGSWLELANRDETAGATRNCDLWVDP